MGLRRCERLIAKEEQLRLLRFMYIKKKLATSVDGAQRGTKWTPLVGYKEDNSRAVSREV